MAWIVDLVLWPRLVVRALDELSRIAVATEGINRSLDPLEADINGLRRAFEGSNEQLAKLRKAMTPEVARVHAELLSLRAQVGGQIAEMEDDLAGVKDTVEPLQGAAERVGRAVERLPGPGRKRG